MPLTQTGVLNNNITGPGPDGLSEASIGSVTINGATPVSVADTGYQAGDIVQFGLLTAAGTVGSMPNVAATSHGTAGVVGFQVKGTASDTSTYVWQRYRPRAQVTS